MPRTSSSAFGRCRSGPLEVVTKLFEKEPEDIPELCLYVRLARNHTTYTESTLRPGKGYPFRGSRLMIQEHLSNNPWFARGSDGPTAADYVMTFGLEGLTVGREITPESHPAITRHIDKVHARPAYQSTLKKGTERSCRNGKKRSANPRKTRMYG
ncbi:hypothetical protein F5051DRAFT_431066 [Lentinula edodes]|nr:hypothetical protein F5051DRAFT_431066 [Lentinula edodes]